MPLNELQMFAFPPQCLPNIELFVCLVVAAKSNRSLAEEIFNVNKKFPFQLNFMRFYVHLKFIVMSIEQELEWCLLAMKLHN